MRLLLTILFLAIQLLGITQSYYSKNITSAAGLPDNAIRSIFQDSRGYMWIGTDAGVSCWDGETFVIYNTLDGLAGNKVWYIDEDDSDHLWFACFGAGISKFDGENFISYTNENGLVDNSVRVLKYSSHHNCIAIGTNKAISIHKDSTFYNFSFENKLLESKVIITGILENDSCIEFYDFKDKHCRVFFNQGKPYIKWNSLDEISDYGVSSVFESNNGDKYFGWRRKGIIKKDRSGFIRIPNIGQVFGISQDCLGDIWAASWNGGASISPPGGLFVLKNSIATRLNSSYNINTILGWSTFFEKKQNMIFYGTLNKGLYKIPPQYFEYYPPVYFDENQLSVTDIEIDTGNNIWFITDSLLIIWNSNSYTKQKLHPFYKLRYNHEVRSNSFDDTNFRINTLNDKYKNRNVHFHDIEIDKNQIVWLTIDNLGFFNIPCNKLEASFFPISNVHKDFIFDENDTLFLCNSWSVGLIKYLNFKNSNRSIVYSNSLHPIYSQKLFNYKNEIWACSRISGVFMYVDGILQTITDEDSTINKIVNNICFDENGYAYLGGSDGRVEILAPETREKVCEIDHKEYHNSISWLKVARNRLFVGYSDGLRVYMLTDLRNNKTNCQFFGVSEGYSPKGITSSIVDKNNDIWLGTVGGLVKIATELFVKCHYQPLKTIIQKVEMFNKEVDWKQFGNINPWSGLPIETPWLNPDQNNISIYFHTLNYNNPDADQYYYKLDGIDKEWVGPTLKKNVIYPYLNPGKYRFLVKSKNELSGLFTEPAEFKFVINAPWYNQIWFYIVVVILIIVIFIIIYNTRVKFIKEKEEKKRNIMLKISDLETKALQAQMNPHFLFNSINSIQSYILDNDVDEALTYLSSFSKVIRMTLEFVNTKFVSLSDVLDYLVHYVKLENMRFDDLFDFIVICDPDIDPETALIPPMLLQTIIENSIKHGIRHLKHKGTIKLEIVKIDNESYKCIIEDNGVGREKSAQINKNQNTKKESLGLKITKERLDILNNGKDSIYKIEIIDLHSDDGKPSGTRVEVTLAAILS